MKKTLISILSGVLMLAMAGCVTPANSATQQALVETAVSTGTAIYLQSHSTDAPYFIATASVLTSLSTGTNSIDAKSIEAALAKAGQTNAVVMIATMNGVSLADSFIQSAGVTNAAAFQEACGWVATGLNQGIAMTPTKLTLVIKAAGK